MSNEIVLVNEKNVLMAALSTFAGVLSNLTPEQVPAAFEIADTMKGLSEEIRDRLRKRLLEEVQKNGEKVTDKGSMRSSIAGYKVSAIPTKTGVDPKKLEGLLRRLRLDPTVAMDAKVTYTVNETKLMQAVGAGKLTTEDVAACRYDPSFRLDVSRE
jgi:hypothetical protein